MSKETAAAIRRQLKDIGLTSRKVSVRYERCTISSAVWVTIKDPGVKLSTVEAVALPFARVDRDERGCVLGGGNTFVTVEYSCPEIARGAGACPHPDALDIGLGAAVLEPAKLVDEGLLRPVRCVGPGQAFLWQGARRPPAGRHHPERRRGMSPELEQVAKCGCCGATYTAQRWAELELVGDVDGVIEQRNCTCGSTMSRFLVSSDDDRVR